MEDQVKEAEQLGVRAGQLGVHDDRDILDGSLSLVFGSPESWLLNNKWRRILASTIHQDNLIGIVVDEVHVTYKWGEASKGESAFREFCQVRRAKIYSQGGYTCFGTDCLR
ncbi:uncharacterized protein LOC130386623 isoform X2 [Gadus chalcogrammus]|uniref:uncharacterized protein LOC130378372 isoform X2 n=1 Tax=Gadus chalcogrammus TaxID=1042646 RepID=UPI0024C34882|nr:uncharacterized protein LOC130378372 isoform X2 [Gadus chalcogrammus]XP_056451612.1 uncharacterized protein LOC130386623 isoform X2 [Gadus chalcogrammus]